MLTLVCCMLVKKYLLSLLVTSYRHPDNNIRQMQENGWINACAL